MSTLRLLWQSKAHRRRLVERLLRRLGMSKRKAIAAAMRVP